MGTIDVGTATEPLPFRILLATDDSDSARCAEDWVVRLTTRRPRLVEIVSVATPGLTRFGWAMQTYRSEVKQALDQLRQQELALAERLANAVGDRLQGQGVRVHAWARQGDPVEELLAMIDAEEPDMVTVGSRGRSAISELFLGSVSHQLVLYATRPVLVARPPRDGMQSLPRQALVVLSGTRSDERVARWLADEGLLQASRVVAISVLEEVAAGSPGAIVELDARIERELAERTSLSLAPLGGAVESLAHETARGHSIREVLAAADRHECDLIVVPRSGPRRGRHPLAEDVAHQAPCSVLVVPTA